MFHKYLVRERLLCPHWTGNLLASSIFNVWLLEGHLLNRSPLSEWLLIEEGLNTAIQIRDLLIEQFIIYQGMTRSVLVGALLDESRRVHVLPLVHELVVGHRLREQLLVQFWSVNISLLCTANIIIVEKRKGDLITAALCHRPGQVEFHPLGSRVTKLEVRGAATQPRSRKHAREKAVCYAKEQDLSSFRQPGERVVGVGCRDPYWRIECVLQRGSRCRWIKRS
jgi:hypothetical protein